MTLPDQLWDEKTLGEFLGKSAAAVRQMRHRDPGSLPPTLRIGAKVFYDPRDVAAWLAAKKEDALEHVSLTSRRRLG